MNIEEIKQIAFAIMESHSLKTVTISYAGSGDSGQIESTEYDPPSPPQALNQQTFPFDDNRFSETMEGCHTLDQAFECFTDELIGMYHAGYENNEGGEGTVTFNLGAQKIIYDTVTYETTAHQDSHLV
jgi:hypothetical protein